MRIAALVFASLAGLIHMYICYLESFAWGSKSVNKIFGVSAEDAATMKNMAFNQGFYNLFLALGLLGGVVWLAMHQSSTVGFTLVAFNAACMLGAALVLLVSAPHLLRAVLIQGLMPLLALITLYLSR